MVWNVLVREIGEGAGCDVDDDAEDDTADERTDAEDEGGVAPLVAFVLADAAEDDAGDGEETGATDEANAATDEADDGFGLSGVGVGEVPGIVAALGSGSVGADSASRAGALGRVGAGLRGCGSGSGDGEDDAGDLGCHLAESGGGIFEFGGGGQAVFAGPLGESGDVGRAVLLTTGPDDEKGRGGGGDGFLSWGRRGRFGGLEGGLRFWLGGLCGFGRLRGLYGEDEAGEVSGFEP